MRHVGQVLLEYPPLVVEPASATIATAQDRDPNPVPAKPAREPLDHRRFTRPAERQVSHRNDRNQGRVALHPAMIETVVARQPPPDTQENPRPVRRTPVATEARVTLSESDANSSRGRIESITGFHRANDRPCHLERPDGRRIVAMGLHVVGHVLAFFNHLDHRFFQLPAALTSPM